MGARAVGQTDKVPRASPGHSPRHTHTRYFLCKVTNDGHLHSVNGSQDLNTWNGTKQWKTDDLQTFSGLCSRQIHVFHCFYSYLHFYWCIFEPAWSGYSFFEGLNLCCSPIIPLLRSLYIVPLEQKGLQPDPPLVTRQQQVKAEGRQRVRRSTVFPGQYSRSVLPTMLFCLLHSSTCKI